MKRAMYGLLVAQAISQTGSRMTMLARRAPTRSSSGPPRPQAST
jgi:hypothetical protein